jgi:xanthine/CO dehydrogenase XdhC/CoxF family maturation factor
MNLGLRELSAFLQEHGDEPHLVLATVTATEGSSYRKPGAMMLISRNLDFAGLISGGCLEGDLVEHATGVFESGAPRRLSYDLASDDDAILGLGLGCGGVIHLLLQRLEGVQGFGFLSGILAAVERRSTCILALVTDHDAGLEPGTSAWLDGSGTIHGDSRLKGLLADQAGVWDSEKRYRYPDQAPGVLLVRIEAPPLILICGAGPDAVPVARQVDALGWECIVVDHRGAYARSERFPPATKVLQIHPAELHEQVKLATVSGAIVMSHNLVHDASYLAQLAENPPAYLGLLGPRERRLELQKELGIEDGVIKGPAGFDIGAELPASIALSIAAEMHAVLRGHRQAGTLP